MWHSKQLKYKFLIVISSVIINIETFAQHDSVTAPVNYFYLEAGGAGGYGSFNYQRAVFSENHLIFALSIGLSTYHLKDYLNKINPDIIVPFSVKGYYGRNHKIELGAGETYTSIVMADPTEYTPKREKNFHSFFSIGYQFNKTTGGILFRVAYTPIIEFNAYYRHWACIALGYSF